MLEFAAALWQQPMMLVAWQRTHSCIGVELQLACNIRAKPLWDCNLRVTVRDVMY